MHDLKPDESFVHLLDDADERERMMARGDEAGTAPATAVAVPEAAPAAKAPGLAGPRHERLPGSGRGADSFGEVFEQLLDERERVAAASAAREARAENPRPAAGRALASDRAEYGLPPAPTLAAGPGDLVFLFGMRDDAWAAAQALAVAHPGMQLGVAGTLARPGFRHVGGRREATQARADGVRTGAGTLVAVGVGLAPNDAEQYADVLGEVTPDQVWIAVDVTRKPEDTRLWAAAVARAAGGIDAAAVIGTAYTSTPGSTRLLGIPVGWSDGVLS